jgi:hypothetical protein
MLRFSVKIRGEKNSPIRFRKPEGIQRRTDDGVKIECPLASVQQFANWQLFVNRYWLSVNKE